MSDQRRSTKDRTDQELAAYADGHLLYEAQMFVLARQALPAATNDFTKNVLLEVCVLHLRNLLDFFYPRGNAHDDDVVAAHYGGCSLPPITLTLERARKRAHKELAHLTLDRQFGAPPSKAWDFDGLSADLRLVIDAFNRQCDQAKLLEQCKSQLVKI